MGQKSFLWLALGEGGRECGREQGGDTPPPPTWGCGSEEFFIPFVPYHLPFRIEEGKGG